MSRITHKLKNSFWLNYVSSYQVSIWGAMSNNLKKWYDLYRDLIFFFHLYGRVKVLFYHDFLFIWWRMIISQTNKMPPVSPESDLYSFLFNDTFHLWIEIYHSESILKTLLYWHRTLICQCNFHCVDEFWRLFYLSRGKWAVTLCTFIFAHF